jgi:NADH-quinone oxidoreductase subunit J
MYQLFFFLFAAAAIGFGASMVAQRNPARGAMSLAGVAASLASLYLFLGAEFIAVVQLFHAVAIAVLFLIAIRTLGAGERGQDRRRGRSPRLGVPVLIVLAGILVSIVYHQVPAESTVRFGDFHGVTAGIGRRLFLQYLLPLQALPILILVAIIGMVAFVQRKPGSHA